MSYADDKSNIFINDFYSRLNSFINTLPNVVISVFKDSVVISYVVNSSVVAIFTEKQTIILHVDISHDFGEKR